MKKGLYFWLIILIFISVPVFFFSKTYFIKRAQDDYGLEYNKHRVRLHIPIIKSNWHIDTRTEVMVQWIGDDNVIGHKRKTIVFTGCKIEAEEDTYIFKVEKTKPRLLQIRSRYADEESQVHTTIVYQIGNVAKDISSQIADSLFAAEKVMKDY